MLLNCGVGEDSWESPVLQIKPFNPKGNQPRIFIVRTDAEAETPILWPPDKKYCLIWKDPDAGKDWRQEEKWKTEDEMVHIVMWQKPVQQYKAIIFQLKMNFKKWSYCQRTYGAMQRSSCVCVLGCFSRVWLFATLWTIAHQAPLFTRILQTRILEWVAMPSSRGSSWPRDQTHISYVSCIGRQIL